MLRISAPSHPSLLSWFGISTLVLLLALGVTLGHVLRTVIVDRATEMAEETALATVRMGLQPLLSAEDLRDGFPPERLATVETALDDAQRGDAEAADLQPVRLKIFNATGTVVYSDDRSLIGRSFDSPDLRTALSGRLLSKLTGLTDDDEAGDASRYSQLLEVYVPVQYAGSARPDGVMEVYLPYAPLAEKIERDTRVLYAALAGGLTLFYVLTFRLVATASRRLRQQSARFQHLATHDTLTGLPNRALLLDRLDHALTARARRGTEVAVLLIDLDRFKEINDTLGHAYGDALLRAVGPRLRSLLQAQDTLARLGGDEFAVLLPAVSGAREAEDVAHRLLAALHDSFDADGVTLDVEASLGLAVAPAHGNTVEDLLRSADLAMYDAKRSKAGVVLFDPSQHTSAPSRVLLLGELRRALEQDEFRLYYQPKVDLDGEQLVGVEALLRWFSPSRGLVLPADFIPVAENSGLITALTDRVLQLALGQARAWLDRGHALPVAVNLSARCLVDAHLPTRVQALLAEHGVPARLLCLEITESAVMSDAHRALQVLNRLHALGVRLSIDDFGTGYSSMAYLKRLPVDELKIDRSFVIDMVGASGDDAILVRSAVDLGHNLGLHVVAEGVETDAHVTALRALGCDVAQGYHYARPMPAPALDSWLDERAPRTAPLPTPRIPATAPPAVPAPTSSPARGTAG